MSKLSPFALIVTAALLAGSVTAQNLVLHNTLGNAAEVQNSVVGPNLGFTAGSTPPWVGGAATIDYVAGLEGGALTVGPGSYGNGVGWHGVILANPAAVIDPEQGTIETVFCMRDAPTSGAGDRYHVFDGAYSVGSEFGINLVDNGGAPNVTRLWCWLAMGGTFVDAKDLVDNGPGIALTNVVHQWFHVTFCWDRNGIDGSTDTLRVYLNGVLAAASQQNDWGTTMPAQVEIGGNTDADIVGKLLVDDVKLWDAAKTNTVPPMRLHFSQPNGPGSIVVTETCGNPGDFKIAFLTFDAANAGAGFGTGWLAGLHIGIYDVMSQVFANVAPFNAPLDARGNAIFTLPAGVLSGLAGSTIYGVALSVTPGFGSISKFSLPFGMTIN